MLVHLVSFSWRFFLFISTLLRVRGPPKIIPAPGEFPSASLTSKGGLDSLDNVGYPGCKKDAGGVWDG